MEAVGVVGSPRRRGNTEYLVRYYLKQLTKELSTEIIPLAERKIAACRGCRRCQATGECQIRDDFQGIYPIVVKSKVLVLGTPVYYSGMSPLLSAFLSRLGMLSSSRGRELGGKIGVGIVTGRRAGHNMVLAQLLQFYFYHGLIIPGGPYWTIGFGGGRGEIKNDREIYTVLSAHAAFTLKIFKKLGGE
ncbi:flavodoxin family protein [Carboxydothermus ferrireducens]|uniref:Multimeric flavodoxin WrbA n=1 Tax=Carboxydothermus ferrireducens DSM 11255 TaxID=1119529 RepID=A0ABX2RC85_9THEO|nr:flavodoxin family protein [Carboxydothermus ferrireducens]NYE58803.1 multimeric flavodoxin WrbA [Carboxydothermus ferrireducens DSM 11255]